MTKIMVNTEKIDTLINSYCKNVKTELESCSNAVKSVKALSGIRVNPSNVAEDINEIKQNITQLESWLSGLKSDYNSKDSDMKDSIASLNDEGVKGRTRLII